MKRIFLTGSLLCLGSFVALAGNTSNDHSTGSKAKESKKEKRLERQGEVSYFTMKQFEEDFPDAEYVAFSKGKIFDEVDFLQNGETYTAFYDNDNQLVGTTTEKQFSDLPRRAKEEINKKYGDYAIEKVILFDDNEANPTDMWLYDQRFEDEDNYFVELKKEGKIQIVQVSMSGSCYEFKSL